MEFLLLMLAILVGLFGLDVAADKIGVNSRHDFDDPHAPVHGSL